MKEKRMSIRFIKRNSRKRKTFCKIFFFQNFLFSYFTNCAIIKMETVDLTFGDKGCGIKKGEGCQWLYQCPREM